MLPAAARRSCGGGIEEVRKRARDELCAMVYLCEVLSVEVSASSLDERDCALLRLIRLHPCEVQ